MTYPTSLERRAFLPLKEVPRVLARCGLRRAAGKHLHVSTVYRWSQRGLNGHQLATTKIGRTRCTSTDNLIRFIQAINRPHRQNLPTTRARDREKKRTRREARAILGLPPKEGGAA